MYMLDLVQSILFQGLIYWFLAMGLWISFRLFRYPDLSLEMYVVSGGMIALTGFQHGIWGLLLSLGLVVLVSFFLGCFARFLWKWGRIQAVIVSLIFSYAIYSSLLYAFGPLVNGKQVQALSDEWPVILVIAGVIAGILWMLQLFLGTQKGSEALAVASNPAMARKVGLPVRRWQCIGMGLAFFLGHISGILHGLHFGYTNIGDGVGFLMVAIFCVFTSHALYRRVRPVYNGALIFAALLLFFSAINGAIEMGLDPSLIKAGIALLLVVVLLLLRHYNKDAALQIG